MALLAPRDPVETPGAAAPLLAREGEALARAMPRLVMEARRIAATLVHGLHGRRRAGSGENFWQFRRYDGSEAASRIDWRRSARDHHLYVREREWEAAHTIWIWPDRSRSMNFISPLAMEAKRDRALILAFALADIMVRSGERVGIPGLMRPTASRAIIDRMAETVLIDASAGKDQDLPPAVPVSRLSEVVILSDALVKPETFAQSIKGFAHVGCRGHVLQVLDPVEETFPFRGRIEFADHQQGLTITAGRAETWQSDYLGLLAAHRSALREATDALGWTFALHHTDKAVAPALLSLIQRIGQGHAPGGT